MAEYHKAYNSIAKWIRLDLHYTDCENILTNESEIEKPEINSSLINKHGIYSQNIFELRHDTGDYEETYFEELNTEILLYESRAFPKAICEEVKKLEISNTLTFNQIMQTTESNADIEENPSKQPLRKYNYAASGKKWVSKQASIIDSEESAVCPRIIICGIECGLMHVMHKIPCTGYNSSYNVQEKAIQFNLSSSFFKLTSKSIFHSLTITPIKLITCGYNYCTLLTDKGEVASWGYGANGCLGHGNKVSYTSPKIIKGLEKVIYIQSGGFHTAAITESHELFIWGRADEGQIPLSPALLEQDSDGYVATSPYYVMGGISQVALGEAHTLLLTVSGNLLGAGRIFKEARYKLLPIVLTEKIEEISSGESFVIILTSNGALYGIGDNSEGQLGSGEKWFWGLHRISSKKPFVGINCSKNHGFAVDMEACMYGWGVCGAQYRFSSAVLFRLIADLTGGLKDSSEKENRACNSNRSNKCSIVVVKKDSQSQLNSAKRRQKPKMAKCSKPAVKRNDSMCSILREIRKSP